MAQNRVNNYDEFWWPMGGKPGYGLVALGTDACLVQISESRSIKALKAFLDGYGGTVGNDSWPPWMHTGTDHQMCVPHQIRLPKTDLKYNNPKNDVLIFLNELVWLIRQYFRASQIKDMHTRRVAANCLDRQLTELLNRDWVDDEKKTIQKYRKRYRREGYFISTFLRKEGIEFSSNNVERMNKKFAAARNDGGGNRSSRGSEANSVLFIYMQGAGGQLLRCHVEFPRRDTPKTGAKDEPRQLKSRTACTPLPCACLPQHRIYATSASKSEMVTHFGVCWGIS